MYSTGQSPSEMTGKPSSDSNPHVRYPSICLEAETVYHPYARMLASEKFHFLNTARTIPTRGVFQRLFCWIANTNPNSMVFNVIFIRFKVSINSTAAAAGLSLLAVFQWLRLCRCLKRFKVTALKKKPFFPPSLVFQNINHCVAHEKELILFSSYSPNDQFD